MTDGSKPTSCIIQFGAFNTNGIVFDNTPWRPGRGIDIIEKEPEADERKLKNLATRIMSNGVEVLVKDKNLDGKGEQRKFKLIHPISSQLGYSSTPTTKQLLSSAVATFVSRQQISAIFPLHQLMQHNYIIKTCMTTYTYLTTVVHNKRSAISTFETIVSVVTTESLTNLFGTEVLPDLMPTKTKYMEVKTIEPSAVTNMFMSSYPKINKRIDDDEDDTLDLIQPSEVNVLPCTSSCSCSNTKTEKLKTRYTDFDSSTKYGIKSTLYGATKVESTSKNSSDKKTQYQPYEYEINSHLAPTDKLVEKYTEITSDYSDEKESNSVEEGELLTNEQAPSPLKTNTVNTTISDKIKPDKPQKPNKNKFVVADLLKLGSLGIKGLTQLAPVFEKMTGGFIKRYDTVNKTMSSTLKPATNLTAYSANKRVDNDMDLKHSNFPIYIPVDEMETSESQSFYTNATLHQNLAWAAEHKQSKAHIIPSKIIHESPLVNGGIPISPGEIITANSDVIVGKPAVNGPLTLAASRIKLHSSINAPPIDSVLSGNEHYFVNEKPQGDQAISYSKIDEAYDLRPPQPPRITVKASRPISRPGIQLNKQNVAPNDQYPYPMPPSKHDQLMTTQQLKTSNTILRNHGRPLFLDYIPSLAKPGGTSIHHQSNDADSELVISDNSPSSSEVVKTHIKAVDEYTINGNAATNKPFLVDIQPSRVANVLIPHGSSTALVFAGTSEPHKTGDYIDDPLPYPEPGYFGSFSIDAPQMTNVHNLAPNRNNKHASKPTVLASQPHKINLPLHKDHSIRNELKYIWKENKRPAYDKLPPPTSNQETHMQIGPQITVYDPDVYSPSTGDFHQDFKVKMKDTKEVIDKEYENYLAVPPPPRSSHKQYHNTDIYDKNKPYSQRPIVHTKPVQDMKVFLNIQHPVPDKLPTKVTSEIYFASQMPTNKPTPTYTIRIPAASYNNYNHSPSKNGHPNKPSNSGQSFGSIHNSLTTLPSSNVANKSSIPHGNDVKNMYTVTLNTATNVASNSEPAEVVGSSIVVPVDTSQNVGQFNADIPIGTNFAIRVEDNTSPIDTYNIHQGNRNPAITYDQDAYTSHEVTVPQFSLADNRWNKSTSDAIESANNANYYHNNKHGAKYDEKNLGESALVTQNSHANFPMINDFTTSSSITKKVKPITVLPDNINSGDIKRPAKLEPNFSTNSHGSWYSAVLNDSNINNINVEVTTRKTIPLSYDVDDKHQVPQFGQKITSIGKPPTEFWSHKIPSGFSIGKPFTKARPTEKPNSSTPSHTTKPFKTIYIAADFDTIQQPVYQIPIRDSTDKTTTLKTKPSMGSIKPVYENSEEIYDGEDDNESALDIDGEVSSESMKIPVVSSSNEVSQVTTNLSLLQDEIYVPSSNVHKDENENKILVEFNPGTQTEKPFRSNNRTTLQSNTIIPMYDNTNTHLHTKPRPFTVSTGLVLDHQLQQPHWQINHMMENNTNISYEDSIDLNIGEEMDKTSPEFNYKKPPRPIFENIRNKTRNISQTILHNDSIITSTVQIKDKKPIIIEKATEKTTLPTFTLSNFELNHTTTEIIDLSPPPPTMDYNFKPSTNDEMIMGMSPPPPRTPSSIRIPTRVSFTPRPNIPHRTIPSYKTKPSRPMPSRPTRPTRKPVNRDEVSTYRPAFDLLNGIRRPTHNHDQPSSVLLPPPLSMPSRVTPMNDKSAVTSVSNKPKVVFPTPILSGWVTSSGIDFSSSFSFTPSSTQLPEATESSKILESTENQSSENYYSYESDSSSEGISDVTSIKPLTEDKVIVTKESNSTQPSIIGVASNITPIANESDENHSNEWSSHEVPTTDKVRVITFANKNRTRKPYPIRSDVKKNNTNRLKLPPKVIPILKPTKTLSRTEILYPTREITTRKIIRPISQPPVIIMPSIIESSEQSVDESFMNPTEVLKNSIRTTLLHVENTNLEEPVTSLIATPTIEEVVTKLQPTHHAGNEVKISDEIIPTKTEFRTTIVTLTKTLSEPPRTVSSIGYVNLTHTLTVTHTKTSLISQSAGAKTQTLILTNTHTSTVVDIVTEVHTQVQPTTIIETVTKHIPILQVQPTIVQEVVTKTKLPLDDITMSSEENENLIITGNSETTDNILQKIENESDGETDKDTIFVVVNKSQSGGQAPPVNTDIETGDYDVTRNEQVSNNGVSQVLFGEILLAGAPYLETTNVHPNGNPNGVYGKECHPDCKASRNERCQRIDGIMKCVCRPGFARMFPDRPCKPTYTYSVKLALGYQGNDRLEYNDHLSDNSTKQYHDLVLATHEGINRMVMQSDLRDVYHGVHITGFHSVEMKNVTGEPYQGVMNDFYVQLSDNAHESRLKEVIEKYLRNNNYSLGGTAVHAASELMEKLEVSDFDECLSSHFHDCSEHAQCFNLRGTYTCSCLEGFADLSVNSLYPGRICSTEPVGCERCNYHGACYSRDDRRVLCECFQWYGGSTCQINLKVVLISLVVCGALLTAVFAVCAVIACSKRSPRPPHPQRSIVACIQGMPSLHQGAIPKQRADRRALISERGESGDGASLQNASLPYIPAKQHRSSTSKKCVISDPPTHEAPPPPAPAVMIPRARLLPHHGDSRENISRKRSLEMCSEAKLISYLESGATTSNDEMRRKHSLESSYSANKERHNKQGALVSAGFKVSTTVRPDTEIVKMERDDLSSVNKADLEAELSHFEALRKAYSQENLSEWTDAERRLGELTLSEARSVGGTLPASTGRAASSTRLTHQEANTMAERDLGSTFLLPHVHLYKPDLTSDVSEFDSL